VLGDRDKSVVVGANLVLLQMEKNAGLNTDARIKAIANLLKHPDLQVRVHAIQALGVLGIKAKAHISSLINTLWDKQNEAATSAAAVLTQQLKTELTDKHVAEIAKLLQSTDAFMRSRGSHVLGLLGPKASSQVDALAAALKDKDTQVLLMTCAALAEI